MRDHGPIKSEASSGTPSRASHSRANSALRWPMLTPVSEETTLPPPKALPWRRFFCAPRASMPLSSASMQKLPQSSTSRSLLAVFSNFGSMKWFKPPIRSCGSHRQTATHEPRRVAIGRWFSIAQPPGLTLRARRSRSRGLFMARLPGKIRETAPPRPGGKRNSLDSTRSRAVREKPVERASRRLRRAPRVAVNGPWR